MHGCARYQPLRRLLTDRIRRAPWHSSRRTLPGLRGSGSFTLLPWTCRYALGFRPSDCAPLAGGPATTRISSPRPSDVAGARGPPRGASRGPPSAPPLRGAPVWSCATGPAHGVRNHRRLGGRRPLTGGIRGSHGWTRHRAGGRAGPPSAGSPRRLLSSAMPCHRARRRETSPQRRQHCQRRGDPPRGGSNHTGRVCDRPVGVPFTSVTGPIRHGQNCDHRYWLVTSWWNWISDGLTMLPSARGHRSACACLRSAYRSWTRSPRRSLASLLDLNGRIAS